MLPTGFDWDNLDMKGKKEEKKLIDLNIVKNC